MKTIKPIVLIRNSAVNVFVQTIIAILALVSLPFLIELLGIDRFGILSLVWVIAGCFLMFDIGVSRATVKYAAEINSASDKNLPIIFWASLRIQLFIGTIGLLIFYFFSEILINASINMPDSLINEAQQSFKILSFLIPILLISKTHQAFFEAYQYFILSNLLKGPMTAVLFLGPLMCGFWSVNLVGIVSTIVLFDFVLCLIGFWMCFQTFPQIKKIKFDKKVTFKILKYGKWVAVSSIIGPILIYLDRFVIVSVLSTEQLGYYTPPFEAVLRLSIVPLSILRVIFPVFSDLYKRGSYNLNQNYFENSVKYVLIITIPMLLFVYFNSDYILKLWLGSPFESIGAPIVKILSIGLVFNFLALNPISYLQAIGRPDLPAINHLIELPFYILLIYYCVYSFGLIGAALAWSVRVFFDMLLLFYESFAFGKIKLRIEFVKKFGKLSWILLVFILWVYTFKYCVEDITGSINVINVSISLIILLFFICKNTLDENEIIHIKAAVLKWKRPIE